ncbi:MAG: DUF2851 family protein [Bacteroidia bacterium]|nr:DUF2851 family protein [Bacteroidia bacterium]
MTEDFLHYLWKHRLFDNQNLTTKTGEKIQVIKCGEHNHNAGPDFSNARIMVENTAWAGNVELHIHSSDWQKHQHQKDKSYDNVVLHVVYEHDKEIKNSVGGYIPVLELKNRIPVNLYKNYERLKQSEDWIPCAKQINFVDDFSVQLWLNRMIIERLESKVSLIDQELTKLNNDWDECFYRFLSKNFGFKVNAMPFQWLAQSLPYIYIQRQQSSLTQIESLLYGQAGMLEKEYADEYPNALKKEYIHLKNKFSLKSIEGSAWKYLRLRPYNFPTIRISQLANLFYQNQKFFSAILDCEKLTEVKELFETKTSIYWDTHYKFDSESANREKNLGKSSIHNIIINTVVPFLFLYSKKKKDDAFQNRALQFLEDLPSENNKITRQWMALGLENKNAHQSQALLQLKNEHCSQKNCLNCGVGNKLLQLSKTP